MKVEIEYGLILRLAGEKAISEGDIPEKLAGIASLGEATVGDLSFLGNAKYRNQVADCKASLILVPLDFKQKPQPNQAFLKVPDPSFLLALICREAEMRLFPKPAAGIHPSAVVDPTAAISATASIGPMAYVGPHARIGENVVLQSHVVVEAFASVAEDSLLFSRVVVGAHCVIGARNRLHAGVVIGADGFGFATMDGAHHRIPQVGNVITEDDVDIGANTAIDRARFGSTRIGRGTKIDNLVQIGHNVQVGAGCLIVAQVGISGSTQLGDFVIIGGQAGVAGHLKVGDKARIAGQSGVSKDVEAGKTYGGIPAIPFNEFQRLNILKRRLPELFRAREQGENGRS
jgi:UDP-3-O-[3-hydroxymyristoyl] glucosamine N-acyltransferase